MKFNLKILRFTVLFSLLIETSAQSSPYSLLTNFLRDEVIAPIGEVFNQYNTQWCWAFTSYHTMRTYYLNQADNSDETLVWKSEIEKLNKQNWFYDYMESNFSQGNTGQPLKFVKFFSQDKKLPTSPWKLYFSDEKRIQKYFSSDREMQETGSDMQRTSIAEIANKIKEALNNKQALGYCYPPHCVSIYGAVYLGETITDYLIADSIGARKYKVNAKQALQKLDLIMTR